MTGRGKNAKTSAARSRPGKTPSRRCIVTGVLRPRAEMVRFVAAPGGRIVADVDESLPGRGLWLSAARNMVHTASRKGAFAKAAGRKVSVPEDLADEVEGLLARRCLNLIGLARRAGQMAGGFEKVRAWIGDGKGGLIIAAADAGLSGRRKIRALAPDLPVIDIFAGAELGGALGRERAVHCVVAPGKMADRLLEETGRLKGFRQ
jgi:predicted RNA-binding protein YlxR (DUF448 family)